MLVPAAAAREIGPASDESSGFAAEDQAEDQAEPGDEDEAAEKGEAVKEEEPVDTLPRRDGSAARRDLLFSNGAGERDRGYPKALEPIAPVERSDLDAFDPRYRGRRAQIIGGTQPGLVADSSVTVGFQFDDNPLLETSEETLGRDPAAWGFTVEPRLAVRRLSPRTLLQSVLRLKYDNLNTVEDRPDTDLNSFDQFFGAQLDIFGQYDAFNLFTNVANSSSRTALVEETGPSLTNDMTLTYGGGGAYKHALTANSVFQFSGAIRRQDVESSQFDDSTYYQAAVDYRTLVTTTGAFGIGGIFDRFAPDGVGNPNVDVVTGLLSWSDDISPRVSIYVEAGGQVIMSEEDFGTPPGQTMADAFARASVYWAVTERDRFTFRGSRSANPTAEGEVRTNNQFDVVYLRQMTRNITVGVPVTVIFQNNVIENDFDSRTFFQVGPNLAWAFAPAWALAFEYRFRLDKEQDLSAATSNAVFLSVSYLGRLIP